MTEKKIIIYYSIRVFISCNGYTHVYICPYAYILNKYIYKSKFLVGIQYISPPFHFTQLLLLLFSFFFSKKYRLPITFSTSLITYYAAILIFLPSVPILLKKNLFHVYISMYLFIFAGSYSDAHFQALAVFSLCSFPNRLERRGFLGTDAEYLLPSPSKSKTHRFLRIFHFLGIPNIWPWHAPLFLGHALLVESPPIFLTTLLKFSSQRKN